MKFLSIEPYSRRWTWKAYLFIWTWLSLLIICSDGVFGQDKQLMILSQDTLSPSLASASDLSNSLGASNDILRIQTEEFFPKKLEKSFQKHRWKINKDFSISPLHDGKTPTTIPLVTVPNPISRNVTQSTPFEADVEDKGNSGRDEIEDDDPEIIHLMTTAAVQDIPRISSSAKSDNITTTAMPLELISPEILKIKTEDVTSKINPEKVTPERKQVKLSPKTKDKRNDISQMNHMNVDIELLKINSINNSINSNVAQFSNNKKEEIAAEEIDGESDERLIPQMVNVTTEDVYISMESDENLEDSIINPKISSKDFPSTTNDPPVITVNASGIFPQTNLSSIWDRGHKSHKHSLLSSFPNSEEDEERNNASEMYEDSAEEEKQEKTMMMKRRPRRSVVHLYDMVVCATGCNPLIYKGYGCFCGFMGSGLTVDGIDKCCYKHDWCYHHAKCPPLLTYFVPYYWTCNGGHPKCVSDFRGWKGICGAHLCECDRQFAECLRKYPCPRTRAMCMTSPWRFWQNIVMPPPYYG